MNTPTNYVTLTKNAPSHTQKQKFPSLSHPLHILNNTCLSLMFISSKKNGILVHSISRENLFLLNSDHKPTNRFEKVNLAAAVSFFNSFI